jgi:hypothetical protein
LGAPSAWVPVFAFRETGMTASALFVWFVDQQKGGRPAAIRGIRVIRG